MDRTEHALTVAREAGVTIQRDRDHLLLTCARGDVPEHVIDAVRKAKPILLALLLAQEINSGKVGPMWTDDFKDVLRLLVEARVRGATFDLIEGKLTVRNIRKLPKALRARIEINRQRITWLLERLPEIAQWHSTYYNQLRAGYINTMDDQSIH